MFNSFNNKIYSFNSTRMSDRSSRSLNYSSFERNIFGEGQRHAPYGQFFSPQNVAHISNAITERLRGVHPEGKNIIVSKNQILSVMDSIYQNTSNRNLQEMTEESINHISEYIYLDYEARKQHNTLSAWVNTYPEDYGMRQTPKIKLKERRPATMSFNYNY